jgi:formylglycine-generating enzyme required for sulfatase activity
MDQTTSGSLDFQPKEGTSYDSVSGLPLEIVCLTDHAEMVLVPAGEFKMGSSEVEWRQFAQLMEPLVAEGIVSAGFFDKKRFRDEMPQRCVYLDTFYIDKYGVTNLMYRRFCQQTGHRRPLHWSSDTSEGMPFGLEYHPVTYVDWHDAWSYARWAGKRLPTEAEWEKAARGTDGRTYPWGDHFDHFKAHYVEAYYARDLKSELLRAECQKRARVTRVDSYPEGASPYGAMDMVGNVWEWVNDWVDRDYYSKGPLLNPQGPSEGEYRVVRGGASDYDPQKLRCAYRGSAEPTRREWSIGFRCALTVDEKLIHLLKSGS